MLTDILAHLSADACEALAGLPPAVLLMAAVMLCAAFVAAGRWVLE